MTRREPSSEQTEPPPLEQEPEHFSGAPIVKIGLATLAIFALGIVWSTEIWMRRSKDLAPNGSGPATELGKREIGIVDQVPFDQMNDPAELRERKILRLTTYGYVDKAKGVVHLPIERGYELAIAEQKGQKP